MFETANLTFSFRKSGSMDNSYIYSKVIDETKLVVDNVKIKEEITPRQM